MNVANGEVGEAPARMLLGAAGLAAAVILGGLPAAADAQSPQSAPTAPAAAAAPGEGFAEEEDASGPWVITSEERLSGENAYADRSEVTVGPGGRLLIEDDAALHTPRLTVDGGVLEVRRSESVWGYDADSTDAAAVGGDFRLSSGGRVIFDESARLEMRAFESAGGALEVRGALRVETPSGEDGADGEGETETVVHPANSLSFSSMRFTGGRTTLLIGGGEAAEAPGGETHAYFGAARVAAGSVTVDPGAELVVELRRGGRMHWGGGALDTASADFYGVDTRHPDAGTLCVMGSLETQGSYFITVGETDRTALDRGLNLLVAGNGVLEVDGPAARLATGAGTRTHFDPGAVLWILPGVPKTQEPDDSGDADGSDDSDESGGSDGDEPSPAVLGAAAGGPVGSDGSDGLGGDPAGDAGNSAAEIPSEGVLTQIDFSQGVVTGLENLTIRLNESGEEASFYVNAEGRIVYQTRPPSFDGPFKDLLESLWLNRRELDTPAFWRSLLTLNSPEGANDAVMLIAGSTALSGTRERMVARDATLSGDLLGMLHSAELRGRVPEPAPEDSLRRRLPEAMTNIPVLIEASTGRSRTRTALPGGVSAQVDADETRLAAALVLGRGDWRFGLRGAFIETDPDASRMMLHGWAPVAFETSSETSSVTGFARLSSGRTEILADLTWTQSSDKASVFLVDDFVRAEGVKRTLWSAGVLASHELARWDGWGEWTISGLAGLRGWRWEDVDASWSASGGEVLRTREKGETGATASAGASLRGGASIPRAVGWPEFVASRLPARVELEASAAAHASSARSGSMRVESPSAPGVAGTLPLEGLERLRLSASVTAAVQFPATRLELGAYFVSAGSAHRAASLSARLSWVFNEI